MKILSEIAQKTKARIEEQKSVLSKEELIKKAQSLNINYDFPFEKALAKKEMSFICEVKKASPSKGVIAENFPYLQIAKEYEQAGADAISCLTEPYYFMGKDEYVTEISQNVSIPVLRKDFTVDDYMIYQAKILGASAALLIVAILSDSQLCDYIKIAQDLGLSALVEAHDKEEIERAINAGAKIIGVNNRDLRDFSVDIQNSVNLRKFVPRDILFVSESGIKTRDNIKVLEENGTNAALIGETFMRSENKKQMLDALRGRV